MESLLNAIQFQLLACQAAIGRQRLEAFVQLPAMFQYAVEAMGELLHSFVFLCDSQLRLRVLVKLYHEGRDGRFVHRTAQLAIDFGLGGIALLPQLLDLRDLSREPPQGRGVACPYFAQQLPPCALTRFRLFKSVVSRRRNKSCRRR